MNRFQNEDLTAIGVKLGDHLAKDTVLRDYCQKFFARPLNITVGPQEDEMPSEGSTPYVFLHDFSKSEGAMNTKPAYQIVFCIGTTVEPDDAVTGEGVIVAAGMQRTSELMTLIQAALYKYGDNGRAECNPPTVIEQQGPQMVGNSPIHWEGFLVAVWQLEKPLNQIREF